MKHLTAVIVALLFILTMVPPTTTHAQEVTGLPSSVEQVKVSSYMDGDKIKVALDGERVELGFIGADAPEPKECYVAESNAAMKKLLPKGTILYLETDTVEIDADGRLLRHVWTAGKGGKAYLVNAKLIRDGNAGWKSQDAEDGNDGYADRYEKAQADAKESENGLWAECSRLHSKARTKSQQRADAEAAEARAAQEEAAAADAAAAQAAAEEEAAAEAAAAAPVDDYFASGPATPAEKEYMREVRNVIAGMIAPNAATTRIFNDPDFTTDVTLWFQLVEEMRPYHLVYTRWLQLAAPTARLEAYHLAVTNAIYNYDQAATNFELFTTVVDITYVYLATDSFEAAGNALDQAVVELNTWEQQTGFDVSDDL